MWLGSACLSSAWAIETSDIQIPFEKFTLDNGLTVIVHEDRKAPIVAVSVWYHVGSKDEPEGRTGFAHLFEHIMFEGSENYNDRFSKPLEQVGATELNGTTWFDRTNYFENVPTPALELALFLENKSATADELDRVVRNSVFSLPGQYETNAAVLNAMLANNRFSRPDDYVNSLPDQYQSLSLEQIQATADEVLHPQALTWVIVGDAAVIRASLQELNLAPVQNMDSDGNILP